MFSPINPKNLLATIAASYDGSENKCQTDNLNPYVYQSW